MSIQTKSMWATAKTILTGFILIACSFGIGYWQGQRTAHPSDIAVAADGTNSALDNDPARLNPAHPTIPANATPEMKEFLEDQATLSDKMASLRGKAPGGSLSPQVYAQFRQENADLLKRQSQLAQILAQQQQNNGSIPMPQSQPSPANSSPQLQAYLTARDSLLRDQVAFMNQHTSDSLADKQTAMQQWRKDNVARFQQLEQLAAALTSNQTSGIK